MDGLEKIKRHLSKSIPITLKNENGEEDTFDFKPLNVEQQAILTELNGRISSREKIEFEGIKVPKLNKEDINEMFDLILDITRNSIKDLDEETLIDFVNTNFDQLGEKLVDLIPNAKEKNSLERLKKKQEGFRNDRKQSK